MKGDIKYIYFARSIRGDRGAGRQDSLDVILAAIRGNGYRPAFEIKGHGIVSEDTDAYIYKRDLYMLNHSKALIALVHEPSHGVGFEVCYAQFVAKVPILCVWPIRCRVSAMLTGNGYLSHYGYTNENDLTLCIEGFLNSLL